ncbi:MAG: hypothetical protein ACREQV_04985 [Candidatus Binatia bacterium]
MDWYFSKQGIKERPYSETQIHALLREDQLSPDHLARSFGRAGGMPIRKISELLQGSSSTPTPIAQCSNARGSETDSKSPRASYCVRHWRGTLSLPVSFWINGNATSLALVALVMAVASTDAVTEMPRWFSAAGVAYWLFLIVMTVWQLVGVWRSAGNYLCQGKSQCWGRLAQAMVIAGIIASIFSLAIAGVPQTLEFAQLAVGRDPIGSYQLRLSPDAREIEISGAIVFGLTDEVSKALDAKPAVKIIHLNSHGGRVGEARRLRNFIAERKLTTFTGSGCFSACTIAYAAGERRLIGKNASLGFHQYAFPGVHESAFRRQYEKDKGDWLARGFDPAFIERAYATPPDDLWQPEHRELFAARFVTGYAGNKEIALSAIHMDNAQNGASSAP